MKALILSFLILFSIHVSFAQESKPNYPTYFNLGIGAGLDYGGVGVKIPLITFVPYAQLVGGLGYTGAGPGFNLGMLLRSSLENQVATYCTVMYGYTGVLITESAGGNTRTERTFYGLSLGGGIEFRTHRDGNFFTLGLLFPIRSEKFDDSSTLVKTIRRPGEVVLSVGYHFTLRKPN